MTMASNEKHNQKKQNSDQNKNESIKHLLGTKSFLDEKRHQKIELKKKHVVDWRMRHRLKTGHVALVLCMNIGVDPPDVVKVNPCARLECWIDPFSLPHQKVIEVIAGALKAQYERWQPRARYKLCLDPTTEEVKKTCVHLRKSAKKERVLFHYNGHGVPKPTPNGEIWVFNKSYTQYIPLSIYDLSMWMETPSVYVFDCSAAGMIVKTFQQIQKQRKEDGASDGTKENIILAACGENEILPMNPEFPADLFTSCLTTPIRVALKWFLINNKLLHNINPDLIDKIPGKISDRRTPLGELNWIFTAVTDTIAWNTLPRDLFHKLFRQDLLLASLFRNYILADRIMRSVNCTPVTCPKLPPTHNHPLWQAWDLAVDMCVSQLPNLIANPQAEYKYSSFFSSHLTDFEVWLDFGNEKKQPPKQLPILLQVLLSQTHRAKGLTLFGRFMDMGHWALNLALSVGIFPYVLKLLQSSATDIKQLLAFIWAKILALDKSGQVDLVKDNGHIYFINILQNTQNTYRIRYIACFVLSAIVDNYIDGKIACYNSNLLNICGEQLNEKDPILRRWLCLTIAKLLEGYEEAKEAAISAKISPDSPKLSDAIAELLYDEIPEVRAAAVYTLAAFVGDQEYKTEQRIINELRIGSTLYQVISDGSHLVRKELVYAIAKFLKAYEDFVSPSLLRSIINIKHLAQMLPPKDSGDEKKKKSDDLDEPEMQNENQKKLTYFALDMCRVILLMCTDPMKEVSDVAMEVFKYMLQTFFKTQPVREHKLTPTKSGRFSRKSAQLSQSPFEMLNEEKVELPNSKFYEWSAEYFSQPLIKQNINDDDSFISPKKKLRQQRNLRVIQNAQLLNPDAGRYKLEEQIGFFGNENSIVSCIKFHPFESLLMVADERDRVTVWNWSHAVKTNDFYCGHRLGGRITDLQIINPMNEKSLLLVSSNSGAICFYKHYDTKQEMVTAFRAVPEPQTTMKQGPGIITDWHQATGHLFISGEMDYLNVWDLEKEICVNSIPTDVKSCVTCLSCDQITGNTVAAGCGNGTILLFDKREKPSHSVVARMKGHQNWVVNLHIQQTNSNQVISGSGTGNIKFWDIRQQKCVKTLEKVCQKGAMTALTIHDYAPVLACGSSNQSIKVLNTSGESLSTIYYHDGFLSQRIGPISSLTFHPYRMILAAGATDSIISIYSGENMKKKKDTQSLLL